MDVSRIFDTANVYSLGKSEEILGRALKDFANSDEVVIATKLHGKMRGDRMARDCRARRSSARSIRA
ncbi:MAG TPA: aldo/keto reductase [Propionibacteriaceae bacterium]|nr:aldo/keto reductase [Propionibacteriaceae bacterium]